MERMITLGHGEAHSTGLSEGATSPSVSPNDSLSRQQEIESAFCRDFRCCGQQLPDLHELLHHYEEHHACTEDDDDSNNNNDSLDTINLDNSFSLLFDIYYDASKTVDPVNTTLVSLPVPESAIDEDDKNPGTPMSNNSSSSEDEHQAKTPVNGSFCTLSAYQGSAYKDLDWLVQVNQALLGDSLICEDTPERPYRCEVQGCDKAYKNVNGLKYHKTHGHCNEKDEDELERNAKKPYHCAIGFCRKRYKNLNGLKYHIEHTHMARLRRQHK